MHIQRISSKTKSKIDGINFFQVEFKLFKKCNILDFDIRVNLQSI